MSHQVQGVLSDPQILVYASESLPDWKERVGDLLTYMATQGTLNTPLERSQVPWALLLLHSEHPLQVLKMAASVSADLAVRDDCGGGVALHILAGQFYGSEQTLSPDSERVSALAWWLDSPYGSHEEPSALLNLAIAVNAAAPLLEMLKRWPAQAESLSSDNERLADFAVGPEAAAVLCTRLNPESSQVFQTALQSEKKTRRERGMPESEFRERFASALDKLLPCQPLPTD